MICICVCYLCQSLTLETCFEFNCLYSGKTTRKDFLTSLPYIIQSSDSRKRQYIHTPGTTYSRYEGCPKSIRPWAIKAKIIDQSANNFCGSYLHPSCACEQNFRPVTLLVTSLEYWNWNGVELHRRCTSLFT